MKIEDIRPATLEKVDKQELGNLHLRMHQLWGLHFAGNTKETTDGLTREDLLNAHEFIVEEMRRREMKHDSPLEERRKNAVDVEVLPVKIMVVPQFVSIVGSEAARGEGDDVDVLIRSERVEENKFVIWADNVVLPVRKVLDPEKAGLLHFLDNPQGPHAENIPLYDLMLVRSGEREKMAARPGLYLVEPHAEMIYEGKKKAIVKCRKFDVAGETYILVSRAGGRGKAYGEIVLEEPREISLDEFVELRDEHLITEEERVEWWPDYETLYYYDIQSFKPYDEPREIDVPRGVQTFMRKVVLGTKADGTVKIDLGCGENRMEGYIGVDYRSLPGVDIVHDLENGLPFPDNYADEIRAWHVLEHLSSPLHVMCEVWRVLKPGGVLAFEVPSTQGEGAFAHPLHKSWWNKSSFYFYVADELRAECGFTGKFDIEELDELEVGDGDLVYVRGKLRAVKESAAEVGLAVSPWYTGPLPKPSQRYTTDFLSIDELWEKWAKSRI